MEARLSIPPVSPVARSVDIAGLHNKAVEAYQAGRFHEVQALADTILAQDVEHIGALHLQGLLALACGQPQRAQQWLDRAIRIGPEPILFNTLYAIQLRLGNYAEAVDSLRQGLAIQPDFVALHYNLALTLHHLDCLEDAALSYRRTLELDPDHSAAHNNLGRISADLGALNEAERHYRRAIELAPANLVARNNLAMVLLASGRYRQAWPYFEDRWVSFKLADGRPAPVPVQAPLPRWSGERVPDTDTQGTPTDICSCSMNRATATVCSSSVICRWRLNGSRGSATCVRRRCVACMSTRYARAGRVWCCSTRYRTICASGTATAR
jgi:tetratricopeptide (TPR) repeat protein